MPSADAVDWTRRGKFIGAGLVDLPQSVEPAAVRRRQLRPHVPRTRFPRLEFLAVPAAGRHRRVEVREAVQRFLQGDDRLDGDLKRRVAPAVITAL